MKTINLTKGYHFTTELSDEGFRYELLLTMEDNQVTLRRVDSEYGEHEDYLCAQGMLPVLRELVSSIIQYYSCACYELGDTYNKALSIIVYKLFSQEELKHLMQVYKVSFIVDLMEILLAKGKLDYLKD